MAEASLASLWVDAITKYEESAQCSLNDGSLESPPAELRGLESYLEALDISNEQFSAWRQEKRKVVSAFRKCILPLQFILSAADKGLQGTPVAPVSALLFAVKHLLKACEKVSKAFDAVEQLFQRVAAVTRSLEAYNESSLVGSHQTVVVEVLSCLLRLIGLAQAKVLNPSRLRQFGRDLFHNEEEVTKCLVELERRVQDELGYVVRLSFGITQQMKETTLTIKQDLLEIKRDMSKSRGDHVQPLASPATPQIAEALKKNDSADEIRKHHRRTVDAIATTTGTWILSDSMFAAWENGNGSVLWIFGRPGVGKTVLAAATIEALKVKYSSSMDDAPSRPVGYLYFKENQPKLQNFSHMLLAVALQLAKQDERFSRHLADAIKTYPGILAKVASAESLWDRLFLSYDPSADNEVDDIHEMLYIIVDGLDEAEHDVKQVFLICLKRLLALQPNHERASIQVAVFTRPEIRNLLENTDKVFEGSEKKIDITEDKNQNDIRLYVRYKTKQIAAVKMLHKLDAEQGSMFESFIEESIVERSQGMFLWAKLVLDQIQDSPSTESVEQSLSEAPSGLMDVIHMVFLRLNSEDGDRPQYLTHLLAWVLCCRRPLTIAELYICLLETVELRLITISDDLTQRYSSLFEVVQNTNEDEISKSRHSQKSQNEQESEDEMGTDTDNDDMPPEYTPIRTTMRPSRWKRLSLPGLPESWHRSTVGFAHAKIRDYLEREGDPIRKKWDDCKVVPSNIDRFKMQMVRALLDLAMRSIDSKYGVQTLKEYAEDNCVSHLLEIDLATMPEDLCGQVGAKLASLCYHGERFYQRQHGQWHTTIDTWIMDNKKTSVVRALMEQGINYLNGNDPDIAPLARWARQAVQSARILLEPLISHCAHLWLGKKAWDDEAWFNKCDDEIWVLVAYEYLEPDGQNIGPVDVLKGSRRTGRITLELIEQVARSQKMEEDEYWLTGVAWTMMQGANAVHTKRAIKYFKSAIAEAEARSQKHYGRTVSTAWIAYEGLSRCYGDNLRKPTLAIPVMEKAIEALPQRCVEIGVAAYFEARMALWEMLVCGDCNKAIRLGREAYERCQNYVFGTNSPSDDVIAESIKLYLDTLSRTQDYTSVAAVLRDIAIRATTWPGCSLLSCFLRHKFNDQEFRHLTGIIAITLYTVSDPALEKHLQDNFRQIAYVDKSSKPRWADLRLAVRSAQFLHRHFKDTVGATKVYKSILAVIDSSDEAYRQRMSPIRDHSAAFLSLCHFNDAVKAQRREPHELSQAAETLRALATKGRKRHYRAAYSALLFGIWLRDRRQKPRKLWRPTFVPSISEAIYKLHDEDPWNDDDAYDQLGEALMMGDDFENAAVAFGIAMKATDGITPTSRADRRASVSGPQGPEEVVAETSYEEIASCSQFYRCDGICDPNKEDFAELWCCSVCHKTWLCGDCRLLLKKQDPEKDRYVVCSIDHQHLRVYPLSEQAKTVANALQRGDFDIHRQWLRTVETSWNIGSVAKERPKQ